jgi:hypothetical protein
MILKRSTNTFLQFSHSTCMAQHMHTWTLDNCKLYNVQAIPCTLSNKQCTWYVNSQGPLDVRLSA